MIRRDKGCLKKAVCYVMEEFHQDGCEDKSYITSKNEITCDNFDVYSLYQKE